MHLRVVLCPPGRSHKVPWKWVLSYVSGSSVMNKGTSVQAYTHQKLRESPHTHIHTHLIDDIAESWSRYFRLCGLDEKAFLSCVVWHWSYCTRVRSITPILTGVVRKIVSQSPAHGFGCCASRSSSSALSDNFRQYT